MRRTSARIQLGVARSIWRPRWTRWMKYARHRRVLRCTGIPRALASRTTGRQSWTIRSSPTMNCFPGTLIHSTTASSAQRMRSLGGRHARTRFHRLGVGALGVTSTRAIATTRMLAFRTISPPRHPASHCTSRMRLAAAWTRTAVVCAQSLTKLHAGATLIARGPVVRAVLVHAALALARLLGASGLCWLLGAACLRRVVIDGCGRRCGRGERADVLALHGRLAGRVRVRLIHRVAPSDPWGGNSSGLWA